MNINLITLTPKQEKALKLAKEWWNNEKNERPFVIAGIAGSGKTTVLNSIIELLNLSIKDVAFVAYTGMAASVLTRKGNPATTIHKLIYDPIVDNEKNEINFQLKKELSKNLKLIIVDEISMVSNRLLDDLRSFNIPILASGDPCQLPPVMDNMNNLLNSPDIFLDEPLRQSLENPIIWLANKARKGEYINYDLYGNNAIVIRRNEIRRSMYKEADQIIACKNNTVDQINRFYRKFIKQIEHSPYPKDGEKLICLRNNWDNKIIENGIEQYLTNGLIGYCYDIKNYYKPLETFRMTFQPGYFNEKKFNKILVDGLYFSDGIKNDSTMYQNLDRYGKIIGKRNDYTDEKLEKINKFTYGYAITCHKSQGSEYNNVLFIAEFLNKELYNKSLYTGITRAKNKLILVK